MSRAPQLFISYSWETDTHNRWVRSLATRLRGDGVDVVLDQWHAALGEELPAFMEHSVVSSDYILIICTPTYKAKADARRGGVGFEGHLITAEALKGADPRKVVPVLRAGGWQQAAPAWMTGKLFVDLRGDPYPEKPYLRLLEHLHGDREQPPPLGQYLRRRIAPLARAFRTVKTVDLEVRPIHHRLSDRVRAHVLLCMLAYYVEWEMRRKLRPLLFADENPAEGRAERASPVAPAQRSKSARKKAATKENAAGEPVRAFRGILADLATLTRNRVRTAPGAPELELMATPTPLQRRALDLLGVSPRL